MVLFLLALANENINVEPERKRSEFYIFIYIFMYFDCIYSLLLYYLKGQYVWNRLHVRFILQHINKITVTCC